MRTGQRQLLIPFDELKWLIPKMMGCLCVSSGEIVFVNSLAANVLGLEREILLGKPVEDVLDSSSYDLLVELSKNLNVSGDYRLQWKRWDNRVISIMCSIVFLSGQPEGKCAVITFAPPETAVKAKTLSFEHIFNSNMFGMLYADIHGNFFEVNEAFLNMLGYTREEFTSEQPSWRLFTPEEYRSLDEHAIQQLQQFGAFEPYEKQLIRKDGSRADIFVGGVVEEGLSDRVIAFVIDVSARKRAERAVFKGEELFRSMADASKMMIWFFTPDFKLHYVNKATIEYMEKPVVDEWSGWEWAIHPDDLPSTMSALREAFEKRVYYETMHRVLRPDKQYRWVFSSGSPVFGEDNEFIGYVGSAIDIHDIKEAQATLTEYTYKLEQSNKDLEHFATIASHDLQEPLRKVMMFSDHMKQVGEATLNPEALDDLDRIQRATSRMQQLIEALLDLSRVARRGQTFKKVDLRRLAEEVVAELHYMVEDIHDRVEVMGDMVIDADLPQMRQLLTNLLDNALKFHKPGALSQVKIIIQPDGEQCRLSIRDNGLGMKAEHLDKIFNTFVRLHHGQEEYPGIGIGLAVVKKVVERHDGSIMVESILGEGSTFTVVLPAIHKSI